jgi:hypothetical protein
LVHHDALLELFELAFFGDLDGLHLGLFLGEDLDELLVLLEEGLGAHVEVELADDGAVFGDGGMGSNECAEAGGGHEDFLGICHERDSIKGCTDEGDIGGTPMPLPSLRIEDHSREGLVNP